MKKWIIIAILLLRLTGVKSNVAFEIAPNKNTYIYVKGVKTLTVDIGTKDVVAEINSVGEKTHIIKLKALKPFKKSSILLISETEDLSELPVYEIKYTEESSILKYVLKYRDGKMYQEGEGDIKAVETKPLINETLEKHTDIKNKEEDPIERAKRVLKETEQLETKKSNEVDVTEKTTMTDEKKADRLPYKFIDGKKLGNLSIELVKIAGIDKRQIFYYFRIENNSGQDYEIEDINFEISQKKKASKKQTSSSVDSQKDKELVIKAKEEKEIKYKSNYFSLSNEETLNITVFEKTDYGRGRSLELKIDYDEFSKINTM